AAGMQVAKARSGFEALALYPSVRPEVVVSDVRMPGMSGFDLCRETRSGLGSPVPFIFCTALGSPADRLAGLRLGADDSIQKPTEREELLLRIERHLARTRRLDALEKRSAATSTCLLAGRLSQISAAELLQVVEMLKPGRVRVDLENAAGDRAHLYVFD